MVSTMNKNIKTAVLILFAISVVTGYFIYSRDNNDITTVASDEAVSEQYSSQDDSSKSNPINLTNLVRPQTRVDASVQQVKPGDAYNPVLEKIAITTGNDLIDYIYSEDGKLIMELDNDQTSISYKRPLKIYTYVNNKVATLTRYQYLSGETVETLIQVAYHPDGSVMDSKESVKSIR